MFSSNSAFFDLWQALHMFEKHCSTESGGLFYNVCHYSFCISFRLPPRLTLRPSQTKTIVTYIHVFCLATLAIVQSAFARSKHESRSFYYENAKFPFSFEMISSDRVKWSGVSIAGRTGKLIWNKILRSHHHHHSRWKTLSHLIYIKDLYSTMWFRRSQFPIQIVILFTMKFLIDIRSETV